MTSGKDGKWKPLASAQLWVSWSQPPRWPSRSSAIGN